MWVSRLLEKVFKGFPDCPVRAVDDPYVHPDRARRLVAAGAQTWVFGENSTGWEKENPMRVPGIGHDSPIDAVSWVRATTPSELVYRQGE
jgi:hypothetical protein